MSISEEIKRLQNAKSEIKTALIKRGAQVEESESLDSFGKILEATPYALRGEFTPESDTPEFSLSNLNFKPHSLVIVNRELFTSIVDTAVTLATVMRNNGGALLFYKENATTHTLRTISSNSSVVSFGEDSVTFTLPESLGCGFKAGYSYEFILSGGFEE